MSTDDLARRAVDAVCAIGGDHPGFRAVHAKGTLCAATFTPSADASRLSRAAHFDGDAVRAHVRFSNGSGDPNAPDFEPREGRGMATKFYLHDGTTTDVVAINLPAFFVSTVDGFLDFCRARVPDPSTGEPDPAAIGAFLEQHPEALTACAAVLAATPPESYLRCAYNSLHAYRFVDDAGDGRYVRYRWEPEAGEASLSAEEAEARGPDYLQDDLARASLRGRARSRSQCRSPMAATTSTTPPSGGPTNGRGSRWAASRSPGLPTTANKATTFSCSIRHA